MPSNAPLAIGAGVSLGTATSRGLLKGTRARSPTLAADGATRGKHGDVTGSTAGQQMIRPVGVRLLSPKHQLLS
jgi:hypothetical protein